jgi:hypothetical protein
MYYSPVRARILTKIANLLKCLGNGSFCLFIAEASGRNLGGEEELIASYSGGEETSGGGLFVAVGDGGVDVSRIVCELDTSSVLLDEDIPVAILDGNLDNLFGLVVGTTNRLDS